MNYELAKKLKDAGFPMKQYPEWAAQMDGPSVPEFITPILSELIAACRDGFRDLCYRSDEDKWFCNRDDMWHSDYPDYSTPEEAVARLWLALQKNNSQP